ncbi:hypothetical protein [Nostoc sp. FACHB-888]|nr:hypothetical protein [Nostoc sp. FACHB-888]
MGKKKPLPFNLYPKPNAELKMHKASSIGSCPSYHTRSLPLSFI